MKVLQVHGGMQRGGTEAVIMNWYRNIDKSTVQFDFTTTFKSKCPHDDEIKKLGGNIKYIIPVSEGGYIKHCLSLYKVIKDGDYDVVHSHMNFHGGVVSLISRLCNVKKIVCHAHSAPKNLQISIKNKVLRFLINRFSTNRLACNEGAGKYIYGDKSRFSVLNNAVTISRLKEKSSSLILKYNLANSKIIANIGRIDENKNQKFLVEIAKKIKNTDDVKIILIGDGNSRNSIVEEITKYNLEEKIISIGSQSNIEEWFTVIDMIMLPSIYEGVPMAIVEAQSKGIPSILSDTIKTDVDLGLGLVKFENINDEDSWYKYICKFPNKVDDFNLIETKLSSEGYNIKYVVEELVSIYKK